MTISLVLLRLSHSNKAVLFPVMDKYKLWLGAFLVQGQDFLKSLR